MKKIAFCLFLAGFCCFTLSAQTGKPEQTDTSSISGAEFLDLFSLGYNGASPKINLKTYNFKAYIGKTDLDFYLFNSVPAVIPDPDSAAQKRYISNDVLQPVGGLLNIALGKVAYFGYGSDSDLKYVKGAQMDVRIGGKLIEAPYTTKKTGNRYFPAFQSSVDLRYLIPLVSPSKEDQDWETDIKDRMVGNLSFRFQGSLIQFFPNSGNTDPYSRYFLIYEKGNKKIYPKSTLFAANAEMFFYITNKVYISAGYFFSNDPLIDAYPFFSVSYGHR